MHFKPIPEGNLNRSRFNFTKQLKAHCIGFNLSGGNAVLTASYFARSLPLLRVTLQRFKIGFQLNV
jgi:hypothetical protein